MTEPAPEVEAAEQPEGQQDGAERTYTADEYNTVVDESIKNRKKAKVADALRAALQAAVCKQASADVLHEPIEWSEDFNGENGLPDAEKISEAVATLAESKPWLSRPRGDVGQGLRGEESDAVDLAQMLRSGA
jgi:hypothetical protein